MNNNRRRGDPRGQSSLELLVTLSFGLIILLPIILLAFIQISTSTSTLSATEAQGTAAKLATAATSVGSQGYPAKQLVLIQVPPDVQSIYIGNQTNGVGHEIIFTINTNAGISYVTAYTPVNVSGYLEGLSQPGTYLVNVSAQDYCPSNNAVQCVYMQSA
ncbi:MAG: hypothetical protein KGI06_02510 [Candidatus Micrarchaeota archaeon]|nr:hypothetical protein [Candidatus Micrarchaeota archaeon]